MDREWISVKDELPAEEKVVIVEGGCAILRDGGWFTLMERGWREPMEIMWYVTHWMPLPSSPEVKDG